MPSLGLAYALAAPPLQAAPVSHDLQTETSTVAFAADFAQQVITGSIPLREANLALDFERLANCHTEAGDRPRLTVQLTGVVKGSDFGATGFADMVADQVRIVITARIIRHD